jgi:carboxylesterase type B
MNTVVKTRQGEVRGRRADGVHVFKGIPYASPPFGVYRLRPPQSVEPWSGVRDAMTFGPKSPQPSYPPPLRLLLPELADAGEHCLTLNIWSPDLGSALSRRATMRFDLASQVVSDPRSAERTLWEGAR